jgi:hypothetical protein
MNKVHPIVNLHRYIHEDKDMKNCKSCLRYSFVSFACVVLVLILIHVSIAIHNSIDDDSSNQHRILHEIECSVSEFGCCKNSFIIKKDYFGTNCGLYIYNIDKIYLSFLFFILCICGGVVENS